MSSSSLSTLCGDEDYNFENKDTRSLLSQSICTLLEQSVKENSGSEICWEKTVFHSKRLRKYSIKEYLDNIIKYTDIEESTLILTVIYIDRICEKNKMCLVEQNVYKLILTAVLVATKMNEDDLYNNRYYSKVGKVRTSDLNEMEKQFLSLINHELYVGCDLFGKYKVYLDLYK